jgi:MFS family permease
LAIGFGQSFIQLTVFRGIQGIGAALTVPSAIGIISSYFSGVDRTRALSIYGASGTLGFCTGLIFGGFLTSSLGWRYIFYLIVIITGALGILGFIVLPSDLPSQKQHERMDYFGALMSTTGLILLQFVLSSGGTYGWDQPFIIVLLLLAIGLLVGFTFLEKYISNPIMPLSMWKVRNFAGLWIAGFGKFFYHQFHAMSNTNKTSWLWYLSKRHILYRLDGPASGRPLSWRYRHPLFTHGSNRIHRLSRDRKIA